MEDVFIFKEFMIQNKIKKYSGGKYFGKGYFFYFDYEGKKR